tara:strand:- start:694 stop:1116 length:423 start_codon:yes stop_codon:yes gene_type:complete
MLCQTSTQANLFFEKPLALKGLSRFDLLTTFFIVKPDVLIGWTTTQNREDAIRLARGIVDNHLAACVQVDGPISSIYRWEGIVETSEEWRIAVKFPKDRANEIERWLIENHPYDEPQWLAVAAEEAASTYVAWVKDATRS